MRHSANTKGTKFSLKMFDYAVKNSESKEILDLLLPIISNLCLVVHKSTVVRDTNPGDMKNIVESRLSEFMEVLRAGLVAELSLPVLGLLVNLTASPILKSAVIDDLQLGASLCAVLGVSTSSTVIERGLGVFINCFTRAENVKIEL